MRSIICFDLETTGLDPATDRIVEVGAALYSLEHRAVITCFSMLVQGDGNAAEAVNKIPASALSVAPVLQHAVNQLGDMLDIAALYGEPVFMAHRAEFDRGFLAAVAPKLVERAPWVCSKFEIEWPESRNGASCVEMAVAHGVPVVSAHRALTDAMLIAGTIERVQAMGHDVDAMTAKALRPKALYVAETPKPWDMPDGEWTDLKAKLTAAGFRFDQSSKSWRGKVAVEDVDDLPFTVREVAA